MTPDELRALADALEPMAKAPRFEDFDVPQFCAWLRACADAQPVAWTDRHTAVTRFALWRFINEALSRSAHAAQKGSYEPVENVAKYQDDAKTAEEARAMLAAAPAAPQAEPKREPRPCTCHPDDNPPVPCAQKYALSECRPEPTEAQIDYRALYHDLLFAVGNKHAGETRHETALRYIREAERSDGAALAARDDPT